MFPPSNREVTLNSVSKIKEEIDLINSLPTDSLHLKQITEISEELNKQLNEALKKYYQTIKVNT